MLFSIKIFICTVVAVAISFATGGYLLISSNFATAKDREISIALDEHLLLQYMLESAIITQELQGQQVTDTMIGNASQSTTLSMRQSGQTGRNILVYDNKGVEIYPIVGKKAQPIKGLTSLHPGQAVYYIEHDGETYNLYVTGLLFTPGSTSIYLSYGQDISDVFAQRDAQVHAFMLYQGINILMSAALAFLISWLLTRPVRRLTQTSRRIAMGDYGQRADIRSSDEIGELAQSFNIMAASVEEKINELEQSSRIKDDFIANFTHELKTPMTSIIGYADMLRSRELDPPTTFKAAYYIYSEANRLEALSLKMLNLVMLEQHDFVFVPVNGSELLDYIVRVAIPSFKQAGITVASSAQEGFVLADPDLIKTLLINIVDNARKASIAGSTVELHGCRDGEHYTFTVTDYGRGIPQEDLGKITEAFYMVDKSRSRAQNGVGLGLAIASRIASLHNTTLQFRSREGFGTSVSISLPYYHVQESEIEA
jgi:signal transduction histidine kinase